MSSNRSSHLVFPGQLHRIPFQTVLVLSAFGASAAVAQFDPAKVKPAPAHVQKHFAPPAVDYKTPAFDPWQQGFTSYEQMMAQIQTLTAQYPHVRLEQAGHSHQHRALPAVILTHKGKIQKNKPTLMLVAHQHGNEPAPGEAILVLLKQWSAPESAALRQAVNIIVMPRANPDGAHHFTRSNAQNIDLNRDHLLMRTTEAQAMAKIATKYRPQVVLDMHEFTVGDRWLHKYDGWSKYDVLLQSATTSNLDTALYEAGLNTFLPAIESSVQQQGLTNFWYHTTADAPTSPVSMGGVQPDTWRNIGGLRGSISILHETRGIGIGKQNLARRVHSHVVAAQALLQETAKQGDTLLTMAKQADQQVTAQACKGNIVVMAKQTLEKQELTLIDTKTGDDKKIQVDWNSALKLIPLIQRERPCGYWLDADQTEAVTALKALGVKVKQWPAVKMAQVQRYDYQSTEAGVRQDGRGAIADAQGIVKATVKLENTTQDLPAGGYYVSLAQPLANLAVAALEPDSQNSYVAARLIPIPQGKVANNLLRVLSTPKVARR